MEMQREDYFLTIKDHLRSSYLLSEEKIEAVLPRFLDTVNTLMGELEQLANTDQKEVLSRKGHAMKGALLNLGLHDLADKAFQIEKHQEIEQAECDCHHLVAELKKEVSKLL
jgi:HPt (histidine-containing phosphotransfer) domain-containing protein